MRESAVVSPHRHWTWVKRSPSRFRDGDLGDLTDLMVNDVQQYGPLARRAPCFSSRDLALLVLI